jgi:hypothetical protein
MTRFFATKASRLWAAVATAIVVLSLSASAVFAGEITGNGTLKTVNGRSFCAFSGQEDLQWYTDDTDTTLRTDPTRGDPGHAQNWGQIDKATRAFLTSIGQNPGLACNPNKSTFGGI